jgi:hypothetical protein
MIDHTHPATRDPTTTGPNETLSGALQKRCSCTQMPRPPRSVGGASRSLRPHSD